MPSASQQTFAKNKTDIDRLWAIHQGVAGHGVGRKHDVEVLNRAAVVFITACWEAYVEDVAMEAFNFLLANAATASVLPAKVRALASKDLKADKDEGRGWDLADGGWRAVVTAHRDAVKARWIGNLNTPKSAQVKSLFLELLALNDLPSEWAWQGMSCEKAQKKLDKYITIRGQIAHRVQHNKTVYKSWSVDYLGHVEALVAKTEDAVAKHIESLVGRPPWRV